MNTHQLVIELKWNWRIALTVALAAAAPLLAVTGLLTVLAAHSGTSLPGVALSAPTTLAYQGQVKVNGQPFSGSGQFKFAIVSSDGLAAFWTNDGTGMTIKPFTPTNAVSLAVSAGLFNVLLGDTTLQHMTQPITSGVFLQPGRALRVWFDDGVNGSQQLAPDVALAAVPYALNAQTLDGLDSSAFLTQPLADARYARISPTTQQIALLKWYNAVSTTQSNFAVGSTPLAVAFDGANMWVVNLLGNSVSVLRASDGFHVMTPTVGQFPAGIAFDGANMWVTNGNTTTVSVLRASDGFHIFTPTVGFSPFGIAFDGANMWVANSSGSTVNVLRVNDGFHVMTLTVGSTPSLIAFDGANMWVTNNGANTVSVLRASDGFHVMTPTVGATPRGIAFDGANMWVANNGTNTVSVLRVNDGFHVMTPTVGSSPFDMAFDGANIWVGNFDDSSVSVLRVNDGFHVYTPTVGTFPRGMAFDGAFMWVTSTGNGIVSKR
jgi:hypothetical protein